MTQSDQLTLAICGNFFPEAKAVLAQSGLHDVNLLSWKPCCEHPPTSWSELAKLLDVRDKTQLLVVGACFPKTLEESPPEHLSYLHLHPLEQCFHLICGRSQVNALVKEGSYLVSPAWVANWQGHLDKWGFDQDSARIFFNDTAKKVVLLDTGVIAAARSKVEAFAGYIDLPFSRIDIGLDFISQYLQALILQWRNSCLKKSLATSQEHTANHAMALVLLDNLTNKTSENEAIDGVVDIFRSFFAPQYIHFFPAAEEANERKKKSSKMLELPADYRRTLETESFFSHGSGDGFCVTLQTQAARIGYLDVGRIPFPEYLNRYLNLAISIAPLCALAINKARIAENLRNKVIQLDQKNRELEAAQAQIKVLAGIIPICMYCKEIRDDKGYWNKLENFITQHSEAEFSHGICDKCMEEKYGYLLDEQKPL